MALTAPTAVMSPGVIISNHTSKIPTKDIDALSTYTYNEAASQLIAMA